MACLLIPGSTLVAPEILQAQIQIRDLEALSTLTDACLRAPP